jgi:hypothetical protein
MRRYESVLSASTGGSSGSHMRDKTMPACCSYHSPRSAQAAGWEWQRWPSARSAISGMGMWTVRARAIGWRGANPAEAQAPAPVLGAEGTVPAQLTCKARRRVTSAQSPVSPDRAGGGIEWLTRRLPLEWPMGHGLSLPLRAAQISDCHYAVHSPTVASLGPHHTPASPPMQLWSRVAYRRAAQVGLPNMCCPCPCCGSVNLHPSGQVEHSLCGLDRILSLSFRYQKEAASALFPLPAFEALPRK